MKTRPFIGHVVTVMKWYPNVLKTPAINPTRMAPHGSMNRLAAAPIATPPARVEF